jgi:hypothetical protein
MGTGRDGGRGWRCWELAVVWERSGGGGEEMWEVGWLEEYRENGLAEKRR